MSSGEEEEGVVKQPFSTQEDTEIWNYLAENIRYNSSVLWEDFQAELESERSVEELAKRFAEHLAPNLHLVDMDFETKLALYKKHKIKANKEYLAKMKHLAVVKIHNGCVVDYKMYTGPVNVPSKRAGASRGSKEVKTPPEATSSSSSAPTSSASVQKSSKKPFTDEENADMWQYFFDNFDRHNRIRTIWKDYADSVQTHRTMSTYVKRFAQHMLPYLHLVDYDVETKLNVYKRFGLVIDQDTMKELVKDADIVLENRIITSFKIKQNDKRSTSSAPRQYSPLSRDSIQEDEEDSLEGVDDEEDDDDASIESIPLSLKDEERVYWEFPPRQPRRQDQEQYEVQQQPIMEEAPSPIGSPRPIIEVPGDEHICEIEELSDGNATIPIMLPAKQEEDDVEMRPATPVQPTVPCPTETFLAAVKDTVADTVRESNRSLAGELMNRIECLIDKVSATVDTPPPQPIPEVNRPAEVVNEVGPSRKEFLIALKEMMESFDSPELDDIQKEIASAIQNVSDKNVDPSVVNTLFDLYLKLIGC